MFHLVQTNLPNFDKKIQADPFFFLSSHKSRFKLNEMRIMDTIRVFIHESFYMQNPAPFTDNDTVENNFNA